MTPLPRRSKRRMSQPTLSRVAALVALGLLGAGHPAHSGATLYSFGAAAGDTKMGSCDTCAQATSFLGAGPAGSSLSLTFAGSSFTNVYVNNDGVVSFNASVASYLPQQFPTSGLPALIAPFWADVDTRAPGGGSVWYRTTQDAAFLKSLAADVKSAFGSTPTFNPTFAEVVTWDHVGYFFQHADKLNTFQAVLVSDGAQTYTLLKYPTGGIKWLSGVPNTGNAYPIVGYDAGDGVHYANASGSGSAQMLNLPNLTNTAPASPGTLAYRLDTTAIGSSPAVGGSQPTNFTLPTHSWRNGAGGSGTWLVNGSNWTALDSGSGAGRTTWQNGDSAVFGFTAGTVTLGSPIVALRLKVNSDFLFTSASAANSLQIGQLLVPNNSTTVSFGGSLVVLTNENSAGLVWNGTGYVQQGALTQGQLIFRDNSVLVARGAAMVNGASLTLRNAAQLQIYTAGATTSASTLAFDSTTGGIAGGGTLDLRGFNTSFAAVRSVGAGAGLITNSGAGAATLTIDAAADGNFSGVLQNGVGVLALVKAGSSTQTLSGANTYTGGTTLAGGTLHLGSAGAIGDSGLISFAGGTLHFSAANQADYSARFNTAAGQLTRIDTNDQNVTLANALSSVGGTLTKVGAGILVLAGANAYTGGTTISGGTLQIGSGGTAGAIAGNVVDNATLAFKRSDDLSFAGAISGTGSVIKLGAGILTLSGTHTYTGGTTISGGTLQIGGGGRAGAIAGNVVDNATLAFYRLDNVSLAGVISGTGSVTKQGAGILTLSGANTYAGGTSLAGGTLNLGSAGAIGSSGPISFTGGTLQFSAANKADYSSRFSAALGQLYSIDTNGQNATLNSALSSVGGSLTKTGAGTLILTGANSYTGGTTISGGTLQVGSSGAAGAINGDVVDNAKLAFSRSDNVSFAGAISGTGVLIMQGAGMLTLSGNNTYTGGTTLASGVLSVARDINLGSGNLAFLGGTLTNTGDIITARQVTLGAGGGVFATAGGYLTINGTVDGAGSLRKTGSNILTLAGAQSYTGATVISAGWLKFAASGATASSVASTSVDIGSNALLIFADTQTYAGTISGAGMLMHEFGGTTTLTGTSSHTGGTTISGGTLQVGDGGTTGSLAGNVVDNGLLAFQRSDNVVFAGTISGSGGVSQLGSGTLSLTGANSYSGATTVSAGKFSLNGTALNSAFSVDAGATLSGNATVGALTLAGTLAPGNSPGHVSAGATTFAGGGRYLWEINDGNGLAGSSYDLLTVTGALTIAASPGSRFTVALSSLLADNTPGSVVNFNARTNHSYTLVSTSGGILGFSADSFSLDSSAFANNLDGGQWSITAVGKDMNLQFTAAVPEPGSYALMAAGLLGLGLGRRYRCGSSTIKPRRERTLA